MESAGVLFPDALKTKMEVLAEPVPPSPLQLRLYIPVEERLLRVWLPDVDLLPDHAPDAVQLVALDEDQFRVDAPPDCTLL